MNTTTCLQNPIIAAQYDAADLEWMNYDLGKRVESCDTSGWETIVGSGKYERNVYLIFDGASESVTARMHVNFKSGETTPNEAYLTYQGDILGRRGPHSNTTPFTVAAHEADAKHQLASLQRHERKMAIAYHQHDAPIATDEAYDSNIRAQKTIKEAYPALNQTHLPVGAPASPAFKSVKHLSPMLSLDNAFNIDELNTFKSKTNARTGNDLIYDIEYKIDGVSLSLVYENRVLSRAVTRGDGQEGEIVTDNAKTIAGIPSALPPNAPDLLEIRGEVYMLRSDFHAANERRRQSGKVPFANLRNAAAGSLRHHDPEETRARNLKFAAYGVGHSSAAFAADELALLATLKSWGLPTADIFEAGTTLIDMATALINANKSRATLDYDTDGLVIKVARFNDRVSLGATGHSPRWAIAYKFPTERAETKLLSIDIQVGRSGTLTPVARLCPVYVGRVTVSNSTLHNAHIIATLDLRPGDTVIVERAGEVIPKIVGRRDDPTTDRQAPWRMPDTCPACGSKVLKNQDEAAYRCGNAMSCPASTVSRFEHLVSRDVLDIDGLAGSGIETLIGAGLLRTAADLYRLKHHKTTIANQPGWGPHSTAKLIDAIEARRTLPLQRLLVALGIRECGRTASREIAQTFKTLANTLDIMKHANDGDYGHAKLIAINGIGTIMANEIATWFDQPANLEALEDLLGEIKVEEAAVEPIKQTSLTGKTIVFTGTLSIGTRPEAEAKARSLGAKTSSSISAKTDILVVGDGGGKKRGTAQALNEAGAKIDIITEAEWLQAIGG